MVFYLFHYKALNGYFGTGDILLLQFQSQDVLPDSRFSRQLKKSFYFHKCHCDCYQSLQFFNTNYAFVYSITRVSAQLGYIQQRSPKNHSYKRQQAPAISKLIFSKFQNNFGWYLIEVFPDYVKSSLSFIISQELIILFTNALTCKTTTHLPSNHSTT